MGTIDDGTMCSYILVSPKARDSLVHFVRLKLRRGGLVLGQYPVRASQTRQIIVVDPQSKAHPASAERACWRQTSTGRLLLYRLCANWSPSITHGAGAVAATNGRRRKSAVVLCWVKRSGSTQDARGRRLSFAARPDGRSVMSLSRLHLDSPHQNTRTTENPPSTTPPGSAGTRNIAVRRRVAAVCSSLFVLCTARNAVNVVFTGSFLTCWSCPTRLSFVRGWRWRRHPTHCMNLAWWPLAPQP